MPVPFGVAIIAVRISIAIAAVNILAETLCPEVKKAKAIKTASKNVAKKAKKPVAKKKKNG